MFNQLRQRALRQCANKSRIVRQQLPAQYSRDIAPKNFFNSMDDAFQRMEREFANFENMFTPIRRIAQKDSAGLEPFNNFIRNTANVLMDVKETPTNFEVHVEVPGIAKENLKLEFHEKNRVLSLSGEFKYNRENKDEGVTYHTVERRTGSFSRSLVIPDNVDASSIKAEYKDGVLTVNLPKIKVEPPKKLDIKIE